jgi:hypothetical protein
MENPGLISWRLFSAFPALHPAGWRANSLQANLSRLGESNVVLIRFEKNPIKISP